MSIELTIVETPITLTSDVSVTLTIAQTSVVVSVSGTTMAVGGGAWGEITGTLTDQTDLQDALDAKSNTGHTHTQAESHNSPDTDSGPTSLHHTLGTGANQAAAGNHNHTGVYQPLDSGLPEGAIPIVDADGEFYADELSWDPDHAEGARLSIGSISLPDSSWTGAHKVRMNLVGTRDNSAGTGINLVDDVTARASRQGFNSLFYSLWNANASPEHVSIFEFGGEGAYGDGGVISGNDFYIYDLVTDNYVFVLVNNRVALGAGAANSVNPLAVTHIQGKVSSELALLVKGVAAQSADLQQWQNNAGSVLSYINAAGNASFAGVTTEGSIPFVNSAGELDENNPALFWDDANESLWVGTNQDIGVDPARRLLLVSTNPCRLELCSDSDGGEYAYSEFIFSFYNGLLSPGARSRFVYSFGVEGYMYNDGSPTDYEGFYIYNYDSPDYVFFAVNSPYAAGNEKVMIGTGTRPLYNEPFGAIISTKIGTNTQVGIFGAAGQSGDLLQLLDSGLNVLCAFDVKAAWHPPHLADAAAQNDSVFFSTDGSALSYKDSGGTVHGLY